MSQSFNHSNQINMNEENVNFDEIELEEAHRLHRDFNSWALLGNVDTAIYGAPPSTVTRRQVLEKYQVYADSIIGIYGNGKPSLRDIVKIRWWQVHWWQIWWGQVWRHV